MQPSCSCRETEALLRAAGLHRTRARQLVLEVLTASETPMTHRQIAASGRIRAIDKVTLYRTLATLENSNLLHVIRGVDGVALFCANRAGPGCPGGHAHFQCLECGEMRCVYDHRLPHLPLGNAVVVKSKQLVAFGICAACAKATRRRSARQSTGRENPVR